MSTMQRKVYFFKMNFRKDNLKTLKSGEEVVEQFLLNSDELSAYFNRMNDEFFTENQDSVKAKAIIMPSKDKVFVEIVECKKDYIVYKIGHEKATNTYGIRNKTTLNSSEVPLKEDETLEMYTYCLFDMKTMICAIIQIYGAPTISALRTLFNKYFSEYYPKDNIFITVSSILTKDIIQLLSSKEVITNVTATVSIPDHKILDEIVYKKRKDFKELQNMKYSDVTFSLVGKRNGNIFKNPNHLKDMFETMQEIYGEKLKRFSVKAKDYNETMQDYNVLEYCLTKNVLLSGENNDNLSEANIIKSLKNVYTTSVTDIAKLLGESNEI